MRKSENTEFRREYTADIKEEIIAFANTDGNLAIQLICCIRDALPEAVVSITY